MNGELQNIDDFKHLNYFTKETKRLPNRSVQMIFVDLKGHCSI